jgi:hypothetical protein
LEDRRAAAARIVGSLPHMSDRAIAEYTGLSPKTVGDIRRRSSHDLPQSEARVGKDGRRRPLSAVDGRQRAATAIVARPTASLREIAKEAAVSVGTAHDVRERIRRGEDPVLLKTRGGSLVSGGRGTRSRTYQSQKQAKRKKSFRSQLQSLQKDPSLRFSDSGKELIRWLYVHEYVQDKSPNLIETVPPHLVPIVAEMVDYCAEMWRELASEFQRRARALEQKR